MRALTISSNAATLFPLPRLTAGVAVWAAGVATAGALSVSVTTGQPGGADFGIGREGGAEGLDFVDAATNAAFDVRISNVGDWWMVGVLRFDLGANVSNYQAQARGRLTEAELQLTALGGAGVTVQIFGATEFRPAGADQFFDTSFNPLAFEGHVTASRSDIPGFPSPDDPAGAGEAILMGAVTLPAEVTNGNVVLNDARLVDWLNMDRDGKVVILLRYATNGVHMGFASAEHPAWSPPTLRVAFEPPAGGASWAQEARRTVTTAQPGGADLGIGREGGAIGGDFVEPAANATFATRISGQGDWWMTGVMRFDLAQNVPSYENVVRGRIRDAVLKLTALGASGDRVLVYGARDAKPVDTDEVFDPAFDADAMVEGGRVRSVIPGYAGPDEPPSGDSPREAVYLGQFYVPEYVWSHNVEWRHPRLTEWINADTDGRLVLLLRWTVLWQISSFAAAGNVTYAAPGLEFNEPVSGGLFIVR